jgi:hypothetical protein
MPMEICNLTGEDLRILIIRYCAEYLESHWAEKKWATLSTKPLPQRTDLPKC